MAIVRARNPFVWVRRALLALGVFGFLGVGLLFAAYRFGSAGRGEESPVAAAGGQTDDRTVTAGTGFDYTQISESRQVFRIRADRSRQDRQEMAYLEQVELEIYRQDGGTYTVTSRSARVDQKSWDSRLEGDVVLTGWEDLELRARALELGEGGQVLTSVGAVEFRYPPDLVGRASSLRFDQRAEAVHLTGGVHLRSVPEAEIPMRLDCERLIYLRGEGLVRAIEDVYLRHGDQEIEAYALSLYLRDDRKTLRTLRARWDVRGRLAQGDELEGDRRVEFQGQLLDVVPSTDDQTLRRIRLEGGAGEPASVKIVDGSGLARRITGNRVASRSKGGELHLVEGFGSPLTVEEFFDFAEPWPLRQACARQVVARFLPDGRLGRIDLRDQVELRDESLYLSGGTSAGLDFEAGRVQIEGPAVELYNARGTVVAPLFTYSQERGILRAGGGIQATLEETATLDRTPLGRGRGPIHVEAEEAVLTDDPPAYAFRGGVRAWRGQNLLLADQLRADEAQGEMAASGAVKTVWFPGGPAARRPASRGPAAQAGDGGSAAVGQPIEVTSENLSYRTGGVPSVAPSGAAGAAGRTTTLVYTGGVVVRQEQRTIRCRELAVELPPESAGNGDGPGSPRRMTCRGEVRLLDPENRREVTGDTAVYAVAEERLEVFGKSVELRDEAQSSLVGRYLIYELDAGTVQLKSRIPVGRTPDGRTPEGLP